MNASGILSAVLVLAGALIMAASLLQGRSIKREVSRSLAGTWGIIMALLVFFLAGRVPVRGEIIRHESGAEFEILDADPRRLRRLRVRVPNRPDNDTVE